MSYVTLGTIDHWLGNLTVKGGIATLAKSCFDRSPWLYGQQDMEGYMFTNVVKSLINI